jgi:site-specific recombinase XerC
VRRLKRTVKTPLHYYKNLNYRERIVSEEEYNALIDNARMLMHKAMIETLYLFGCRVSELVSMNAEDVKYNEDGITTITVRDSKTIPRDISIEGRAEYLLKWYENYQHFKGKKNKPLWSNYQKNKHNRYTIGSLEKSIRVICKRACLRHITPHDFRHTAITRFRKNGEDETDIQTVFGLSKSSVMMKVYDHNKIEDYQKKLRKRIKKPKPTYEMLEKKTDEIKELKDKIQTLERIVKFDTYYLDRGTAESDDIIQDMAMKYYELVERYGDNFIKKIDEEMKKRDEELSKGIIKKPKYSKPKK